MMLVGHIGAGLALNRVEPRLNLGVLVFGAVFADLLLWALVLSGAESILPPHESGSARYFTFVFPYSHGLAASVLWSLLGGAAAGRLAPSGTPHRFRIAAVFSAAVFSHFILDFIVHVPDLPVLSEGSLKLGLGLWRHMPIALAVELAFAFAALAIYLRGSRLSRARTWLIIAIVSLAAALSVAGPYMPGEPPPAGTMAASALVTLLVIVLLAFVVEGRMSVTTKVERDLA